MCSYLLASILSQLNEGAPIPLKILTQAKAKEPPSNAIPELVAQMSSSVRTILPSRGPSTLRIF